MNSKTYSIQLFFLQQQVRLHFIKMIAKMVPVGQFEEAVRYFENMLTTLDGGVGPKRYFQSGNRYFWGLNYPGFPSKAYDRVISFEINKYLGELPEGQLQNCILAITTKCGLRCEHCFEWDNLNVGEKLSDEMLQQIVSDLLARGVGQIQFSGGEPLNRFNLLTSLIQQAAPKADTWVLTSGYGLTEEKATRLAAAGCTGVSISLDYFEAEKHNAFRGHRLSYDWVQKAIKNAHKAALLICLTVCMPQDVTEQFLEAYLDLAHRLGATFVQLLEPRAAGRYKDKALPLSEAQIEMITAFTKQNNLSGATGRPIIKFHGAYQRALGCFGAGNRYLYIDSHGKVHKCPFCQNPNATDYAFLESSLQQYQGEGCALFGAFD